MKTVFALLLIVSLVAIARPAHGQSSMFADPKARQAGDIVTVVLIERTAAQRESDWDNRSSASTGGSAQVAGGTLSGAFALDADFNKDARTHNQSMQRDLLSGTLTARVTSVDEAGNLVIEGERKLSVNGESHILKVSGLVRPFDVQYNNTVFSYQIAGASIQYHRGGFHRRFFKPGAFVKLGLAAVLGGAVYFAIQ